MTPALRLVFMLLLFAASAIVWQLPRVAEAESPPTISDRISDNAGVLTDRSRLNQALDRLESQRNYQLFVVFIQTTQPLTIPDFTNQTVAKKQPYRPRQPRAGRTSCVQVATRQRPTSSTGSLKWRCGVR
jgi:hypothetical protein